jgi:hypothetical protein
MKKEAIPKCKGLRRKAFNEKEATPKPCPRNHHKTRASAKPKIKQVHQFTEAGFANPMAEGVGDARIQLFIMNRTKATPLNEIE